LSAREGAVEVAHLSAIENDAYELTKKNPEKIAVSLGVHPLIILFPRVLTIGFHPETILYRLRILTTIISLIDE